MATQSSIQSSPVRDAGFATKPSLALKRRINAAPTKIYAAWTDPEKLAAWFGPSKVREGSLQAETDLRVGGHYRISFNATDGEYFQVGGVYREIVPNELLVMSWAWHSTPERESLLTISLKPDGAGTLLTLHHEQFFDQAARDGHEKGWAELLGKLEQSLT
jgi:uncharacterized protein YndB with AHSA1/START domain